MTTDEKLALDHLGNVLTLLAELRPEDRCRALDEAVMFYNERRPEAKVTAEPGYVSRLVILGPMDQTYSPRGNI